jgi:hypothetical protein
VCKALGRDILPAQLVEVRVTEKPNAVPSSEPAVLQVSVEELPETAERVTALLKDRGILRRD